ncbi:hypothetical protein [Neolewinella persica]|uniref:hypothetical protein n=1 Tax=Neolewinella persica TaxID=70998 RepID=UPI00035F973A|nr:hypothetical protein [Neolewinella persica]
MRTLIPILLLAVLGYTGWYYWEQYTDKPLRANLVATSIADLKQVFITDGVTEDFALVRMEGTEDWAVKREITELYDQSEKVRKLLNGLAGIRTDSIMRSFPEDGFISLVLESEGRSELVDLFFSEEGRHLARRGVTGDVFALNATTLGGIQPLLRFENYRERRLLRILPERIDSITAVSNDSIHWKSKLPEAVLLAKTFIAPATAPYAEYFDEIMDRDKHFATLSLFANGEPHRIEVYLDSLWPKPYVLVGEDYPRRFLAVDSLR